MRLRNAVIVDGLRSAFARGGRGKLEATRLDDAAAEIIRELFRRHARINPELVEDFGIGNGANHPELAGLMNISRLAGLPAETPSFMSNRQCASSMETLHRIVMAIMLGEYDCGIALGVERMSRVLGAGSGQGPPPTRVNQLNQKLFQPSKLQRDMAFDHDEYFSVPIPDYILDSPMNFMAQTAQNVADMYDLKREELDLFAMKSQQQLAVAHEAGIYQDEIVPLEIEDPVFDEKGQWLQEEIGQKIEFSRDENLRPETTLEVLGKLNPLNGIISYGEKELMITAGNSCPTSSGIAAVMVMSEELALKLGLEPLARVIGWGNGGVKQQIMGMGPVPATRKALRHAGLDTDRIERVEFNEAFAAQVIPSLRELNIDLNIVNVNGGSLGIGHPIGATGCRLILTLAKELRRSGKRYGLATQCIGAGQGATTILEALD
ncbi:MAG: thiolase family protein [Deltaproteobacteria bacterium]|nr:thiolase family protein [Deltaproteobacteria bacterium]